MLVEKSILMDQRLLMHALPISDTPFARMAKSLYIRKPEQQSWQLGEEYPHFNLTQRQQQCLFYWVHGKSYKENARILGLSPRTVEHHVNCIREALGCPSKSAIIEKAFAEGFAYFVPLSLVS